MKIEDIVHGWTTNECRSPNFGDNKLTKGCPFYHCVDACGEYKCECILCDIEVPEYDESRIPSDDCPLREWHQVVTLDIGEKS